jgi:pyrroline-5-carboxylate reductase
MRIGFIGAGKMAEAIAGALLRSGLAAPKQIVASDVSAERRARLRRRFGIRTVAENAAVVKESSVVFLAVKPQQMDAVLQEIAPCAARRHLFISIAAGKTIARMQVLLRGARLIRVMPNMGALVGEGMSVLCAGRRATAADRRLAARLLASFGRVLELPEKTFDAVTALSGSGPAFFTYLLDAMADAAVAEGLRRADALQLAEQTMLGTARVLIEQGTDPRALIQAVASPKGTTEAGLKVLDGSDVAGVLRRTIRAAAARSRELSAG